MKKLLSRLALIFVAIMFSVFCVSADSADNNREYIIKEGSAGYLLFDEEGNSISEGVRISEILANFNNCTVTFDNVVTADSFELSNKSVTVKGTLTFVNNSILTVSEGSDVSINGATIKFLTEKDTEFASAGYIRVKGGKLTLFDGSIFAGTETGILLDYSSGASFIMHGGNITAENGSCINSKTGSVTIVSGTLTSVYGTAVESSSTLSIASGACIIGKDYDVSTSAPIRLSVGDDRYSKALKIKYLDYFEKGTIKEIVYKTDSETTELLMLFDKSGREYPLTFFESTSHTDEVDFAAVYLPYTVTYMEENRVLKTEEYLKGNKISVPDYVAPNGYDFCGWFSDEGLTQKFDFSTSVNSDISLYANISLKAPEFKLESLSFTYDASSHEFGFSDLSHPLDNLGKYSFEWYKDGVFYSTKQMLSLSSVSDSGSYKCKVKFSYNGDYIEIETTSVNVSILKCIVDIPIVPDKEYTGYMLYPDVSASSIYTHLAIGGIECGSYEIVYTLKDTENYAWRNTELESNIGTFNIIKAKNSWQSYPIISDYYEGKAATPRAVSSFGSAEYYFSSARDGVYSLNVPTTPGRYYMIAKVSETASYAELTSDAVEFYVLAVAPLGIHVSTPPTKMSYTAFDTFDPDGMTVTVDMNSGDKITLAASELSFLYQNGGCFLYGDRFVTIKYKNTSMVLPVTVSRAEYDLSDFTFADSYTVYDGQYKTAVFTDNLPRGLDGVPLTAYVIGGGTDAGVYDVTLYFETASTNYKLPEPITATLTVEPLPISAVWYNTKLVYSGNPQAPSAYFLNENGARIALSVSGAATDAGEFYKAIATVGSNYVLINPTLDFKIAKADYDMSAVRLDATSFMYDGKRKSVTLTGLPAGVGVIGYTDATATAAGTYSVSALFSYDDVNYNPPTLDDMKWHIYPASYDISGVSFISGSFVYDGEMHYPDVSGSMPEGIDGVKLEYTLSAGAVNVADGKVQVKMSFTTESQNYVAPEPLYATVEITPKPISVSWSNLTLVYNGKIQAPHAMSDYTAVNVISNAQDAGNYTAKAVSADSNYIVINSEWSFTVLKAENTWTNNLEIADIYESEELVITADSFSGISPTVKFYTDKALTEEIETPSTPGVYYAVANVPESNNYYSLTSESVSFEIIKVVPVDISVTLENTSFIAYEKLEADDYTVTVSYNDGTTRLLDSALVAVGYSSGSSLRATDTSVSFSYSDISVKKKIEVSRATLDVSTLTWENAIAVYDGREHKITLQGLPEGISIAEYVGGVGTNAGEYPVTVYLNYDENNYVKPPSISGKLVIERSVIALPPPIVKTYCGKPIAPLLPAGSLTISGESAQNVGIYSFTFTVPDAQNYVFDNGETIAKTTLEIKSAELTIRIADLSLDHFEKLDGVKYTVESGEIYANDALLLSFYEEDGKIYAKSENPNYRVTVIPGKLTRTGAISRDALTVMFMSVMGLLLVLLLVYIIVSRRGAIAEHIESYGKGSTDKVRPQASIAPHKEPLHLPPHENNVSCVDNEKADGLISDGMAKTLISKDTQGVKTVGNRKCTVSIGKISASFKAGERVDINAMKEKGILPRDAGRVKVLADGVLDKPLSVYANDFSLSAVKMIALAGGEAVKTKTIKGGI